MIMDTATKLLIVMATFLLTMGTAMIVFVTGSPFAGGGAVFLSLGIITGVAMILKRVK